MVRPWIAALDVDSEKEALDWVRRLSPCVDLFKVGPGLFLRSGPRIVERIRALGKKVFLDLKLHDIPSAVARAVQEAGRLGVFSLTLHIPGGLEMLKTAVQVRPRPHLWGVTVLTSLNGKDLTALGIHRSPQKQVLTLAQRAKVCGVDGVVAGAQECRAIKRDCGKHFQVVTPGLSFRREETQGRDQKRTATPQEALRAGADFLVLGRSLLQAKDPMGVLKTISEDR